MPYYDHDKDYPFAAFITNLGKYNEGELVGEWVKFPTTAEELKEVFKRIGIGQKDDFGQPYEEWFITDYDCYVDGLYSKLGEYENLDELNYLASKLDEMSESEYAQFQAGMEMGDHCGSLQEIINLTENLDCYEVYPDIHDYDDLGRYYIEELDVMQVPEHLQNYIDYEAYGRDVALEENGTFTDQGYVRDTGDSFHEYYDGERGSIPDEYRVMTFQDDLPEEEKSEWAMDIAFDMDEFFRQNDPQYAAEHPEAHAAKEEIYESLMAGPGRSPDFLQRQLAHALQHGSGDLRTAVLQALARPLGGELNHFFFGVKKHYIVPLVNFVFCVHDSITPNSRQAEPAVFCEVFRNAVQRFALRFIFSKDKQRQLTRCLILLWIISPDSKCRIAGRFFSGRHCSTSQDSYCRRAGSAHRSNAVPLRGNGDVDDGLVPAGTDRFDFGDGNRPIPLDSTPSKK